MEKFKIAAVHFACALLLTGCTRGFESLKARVARIPTGSLSQAVPAAMTPAAAATAYSGPRVTNTVVNGRQLLRICVSDNNCSDVTPFFFRSRGWNNDTELANFKYQVRLMKAYMENTPGATPILKVQIGWLGALAAIQKLLQDEKISPYMVIGYELNLSDAEGAGLTRTIMKDVYGNLNSVPAGDFFPYALSSDWIEIQQKKIVEVIEDADRRFPGKVLGIMHNYQAAGEWFFRPTLHNAPDGLRPFVNDSGTGPGPVGRLTHSVADFSQDAKLGFCASDLLTPALQSPCVMPEVYQLNNSLSATALSRGYLLDPAELDSQRAAAFNLYQSRRANHAISQIFKAAKERTGGKVYTLLFHGVLMQQPHNVPTGGKLALKELLEDPNVDAIAAPYDYSLSRMLGQPMMPQGPNASPALYGKLWFNEDDTRTHLSAGADGIPFAASLIDTGRLLIRNLITAGLQNNGAWVLDLPLQGWFGRPDKPQDSETIWTYLQLGLDVLNKMNFTGSGAYQPEIAVFVDDKSYAHVSAFTPAGENTYDYASQLALGLPTQLAKLGAPIRVHLLRDLLSPNFNAGPIKFAVFVNSFQVAADVRQAIKDKLAGGNRTLMFVYASGYLRGMEGASTGLMRELTGINIVQSAAAMKLAQKMTNDGSAFGPGFDRDYAVTPSFYADDQDATNWAVYSATAQGSIARKLMTNNGRDYVSVYSATPMVAPVVLRALAQRAGVHFFSEIGDTIEARGNTLLLHSGFAGVRSIQLPKTVKNLRMMFAGGFKGTVVCSDNCSTTGNLSLSAGDSYVYQWD